MNKYIFKVADYKRLTQMFFWLTIAIIPILFLSFFFIRHLSNIVVLVSGLLLLVAIVTIYLTLIKYYLTYSSEFTLDSSGIYEKNLKTGKDLFFNWSDVDTFKYGIAKHTNEDKEYLTMTFKSSAHTISISGFRNDSEKIKIFDNFKNQIDANLKLYNNYPLT